MAEEKKSKQNKATVDAGLLFDVNRFRKDMKSFFTENKLTRTVKVEGEDDKQKTPNLAGSQEALTGAVQCLCYEMMKVINAHTARDKSGVQPVNRRTIYNAIVQNADLFHYFGREFASFNEDLSYGQNLPVDEKTFGAVRESVDSDLVFTPQAQNFMYFLLVTTYRDLLRTAWNFMDCAKKNSLGARYVRFAVTNRFTRELSRTLCKEVDRVADTETPDEVEGDGADVVDAGAGPIPAVDDAPAKGSKGGKKVAKQSAAQTIEDDDEAVADDEEEVVVAAKSTKKAVKPAAAKEPVKAAVAKDAKAKPVQKPKAK